MNQKQLEHYRAVLQKQREEINRRINDDQEGGRITIEGVGDVHEEAVRTWLTDTSLTLGDMRTDQFNEIERALARIDRGEFGTCEDCGEPIEPKRLEAIPTARACAGCATKAEQNTPATL